MTERKAKRVTLRVWKYLAKHPEIASKINLPWWLWWQIRHLRNECPLCSLFVLPSYTCSRKCPLCPAGRVCGCGHDSIYWKWAFAVSLDTRRAAALEIVAIVKAWKPGKA